MTTAMEAQLKRKDQRRRDFFDAALAYYAVSQAYSCHRPTDKADPLADDLAAALCHAERELNRVGKLVLGASSRQRANLIRDAIREAKRREVVCA